MKLVDLKRTPAEIEKMNKRFDAPMSPGEEYPWGLTLTLDSDTLDKLGITDLPDPGTEIEIVGKAKVIGVEQSASEGRDATRSVRLQITQLANDELEGDEADGADQPSAASKLYPNQGKRAAAKEDKAA